MRQDEPLWKTIKYEDVYYLQPGKNPVELKSGAEQGIGRRKTTGPRRSAAGLPLARRIGEKMQQATRLQNPGTMMPVPAPEQDRGPPAASPSRRDRSVCGRRIRIASGCIS